MRVALSTRARLPAVSRNDKEREARLAAALRENLKRRKAHAREHPKRDGEEDNQP